jgi:hypothetical protein
MEDRLVRAQGWERWSALAGLTFVASYIVAFSLGIEVGPSDREILDYYADSGHRTREVVAFFLIGGGVLAFLVFATGLRSVLLQAESEPVPLASLAWAGAIASATLLFAGNAISRATAFAAMSDDFELDPDTRRLVEDVGVLLLASGALAAILLVVATSLVALRYGALPRWLGWAGFPLAALLPLGVVFLGFVALWVWVLAASWALAFRRPAPA